MICFKYKYKLSLKFSLSLYKNKYMYGLKIANTDQVSFGPTSTRTEGSQNYLEHCLVMLGPPPPPPPPPKQGENEWDRLKGPKPLPSSTQNLPQVKQFHPVNKPNMTGPSLLSCSRKCTTLSPSYLLFLFYLNILYSEFFLILYKTTQKFPILQVGSCSQNAEKKLQPFALPNEATHEI